MKLKNLLLSSTTIIASTLCLNAFASYMPQGLYLQTNELAGYNIIYKLEATPNGVKVNDQPAVESAKVCSALYGGPCRVNISWTTTKDNKPFPITETITWTSGVLEVPREFEVRVINDLGQESQALVLERF